MIFAAVMFGAFAFLMVPSVPLLLSLPRIRRAHEAAGARAPLSTEGADEVYERALQQHLKAEGIKVRIPTMNLLALMGASALLLFVPTLIRGLMPEESPGPAPWFDWLAPVVVLLTWAVMILGWWVLEIVSTRRRAQALVIEAGLRAEERTGAEARAQVKFRREVDALLEEMNNREE